MTDGVFELSRHSYTEPQARRIAQVLVDALAVESEGAARESIVNDLGDLVTWDLSAGDAVYRPIASPRLVKRSDSGALDGYRGVGLYRRPILAPMRGGSISHRALAHGGGIRETVP